MHACQEIVESLEGISLSIQLKSAAKVTQFKELSADARRLVDEYLAPDRLVRHLLEEVLNRIDKWFEGQWTPISQIAKRNQVCADNGERPEHLQHNIEEAAQTAPPILNSKLRRQHRPLLHVLCRGEIVRPAATIHTK